MRKNYSTMIILLVAIISIMIRPMPTSIWNNYHEEGENKGDPKKGSPPLAVKITPYQPTERDIEDEKYYDSLETLAICVEAEAGNQGLVGKRLVVDVILNRVESDRFPNDIESVIYQKNQFSSSFDGGMDRVIEPSEETFEAIRMELKHRMDSKILFFTAGGFNPYCIPAYKFGGHYFGY